MAKEIQPHEVLPGMWLASLTSSIFSDPTISSLMYVTQVVKDGGRFRIIGVRTDSWCTYPPLTCSLIPPHHRLFRLEEVSQKELEEVKELVLRSTEQQLAKDISAFLANADQLHESVAWYNEHPPT